jgi:hypothetical protein
LHCFEFDDDEDCWVRRSQTCKVLVVFKLDTGVQCNVLKKRFVMYDGEGINVVDAAKLKCIVKNFEHKITFKRKKNLFAIEVSKAN